MLRENTYNYYIVESVVECLKVMGRELLRTKITRSSKGIMNQQNKTGNKLVSSKFKLATQITLSFLNKEFLPLEDLAKDLRSSDFLKGNTPNHSRGNVSILRGLLGVSFKY